MLGVLHRITLVAAVALTAACGTEDPAEEDNQTPVVQKDLLPWTAGNTWTYRVTEDAGGQTVVTDKVTTVGEEEEVGGTGPHSAELANRVVTSKRNGADETVSWQAKVGDRVLRYREQSFDASSGALDLEEHWDPYKLHIDGTPEHMEAQASWLETYRETKTLPDGTATTAEVSDRWTVDSVGTSVTVPAGTFDAIVLRKVSTSSKTYYYVPGVGKVKEVGAKTEELVRYEVAP